MPADGIQFTITCTVCLLHCHHTLQFVSCPLAASVECHWNNTSLTPQPIGQFANHRTYCLPPPPTQAPHVQPQDPTATLLPNR